MKASSRCRRSSTSRTSTTPRISSAGKPAQLAALGRFFSQGAYRNGMVVRIQGYGYQKGFGGHFHNDNGLGVLRDIPGLVIASPSRPDDAASVLRTCAAAASIDGSVGVFLEPIASVPHPRPLPGGRWRVACAPGCRARSGAGSARTHGEGRAHHAGDVGERRPDVAPGGGAPGRTGDPRQGRRPSVALPAAARGRAARGVGDRPTPIVDETRRTGGVGRASSPSSWTRATRAASPAWRARIPSSRSGTRPCMCCCPRRRSRTRRCA